MFIAIDAISFKILLHVFDIHNCVRYLLNNLLIISRKRELLRKLVLLSHGDILSTT